MLLRLYFSAISKYLTANKIDSELAQDNKRLLPVCEAEKLRVRIEVFSSFCVDF